jgi:hypothetical protein
MPLDVVVCGCNTRVTFGCQVERTDRKRLLVYNEGVGDIEEYSGAGKA